MNFWSTPVFGAISGAIIASFITYLITRHFNILKYKTKKLECITLQKNALISFSKEIDNDIEIKYKGKDAKSILLFRLKIENVGYEAITKQPVLLKFDDECTIEKLIIATIPDEQFGEVTYSTDKNRVVINCELLNPKDSLIAEIVIINAISDTLTIYGKNENVVVEYFDYNDEMGKTIKLMEEITKKMDNPFSLIPYFPKVLKTYPTLFRMLRIQKGLISLNEKEK